MFLDQIMGNLRGSKILDIYSDDSLMEKNNLKRKKGAPFFYLLLLKEVVGQCSITVDVVQINAHFCHWWVWE